MKKILSLLLAAALILSAAACGASEGSPSAEGTGNSQTETVPVAETEASAVIPVDYEAILTAEQWKANLDGINAVMEFFQGGSGYFDGGLVYNFSWTLEDNVVTAAFPQGDGMYSIEETDEGYKLVNCANDQNVFVQASRFVAPAAYYEECGTLLTADSCVDVYQSGHTTRSTNGKTTDIEYRYTANSADADMVGLYVAYLDKLAEAGFVGEALSDTESDILENGMVIAAVRLDGNTLYVNIVPEEDRSMSSSNAIPIAIGDTILGDGFEFTLNNVELTYDLKPSNTGGWYTHYEAESGKVYIHVDGTYRNTSKRDVDISELFIPRADYDNGYTYDGFVIIDDGDSGFDYVGSYVACTPLSTCHYHGLIECPEIVDGSDAPLFVVFSVGDGTTYRFDIR